MLTSRNSDLHSHLARRTKKHSGIHTVTPAQRTADTNAQPPREPVFGQMKYDNVAPKAPSAYKSIFGL